MPYPTPEPGLVIGYSYLWKAEAERGQLEGIKDRPCAIILTIEKDEGERIVSLVPITHTPPHDPDAALELPMATKCRLRLDNERSWVVVSEFNRFVWPGPDLRPVSRDDNDQYAYGLLPPKLFERIKEKMLEQIKKQQIQLVTRSE
jgi:hypothetical protein